MNHLHKYRCLSFFLMGICWFTFTHLAQAQDVKEDYITGKTYIDGQLVSYMVTKEGDTLLVADLDEFSFSSPRSFESDLEYRRYLLYKKYALTVYPYAKEAIRIFRETEYVTENYKDRKKRKYIKQLQKEMEEEFEEPLKNLSKTQGKILVKMIERELDTPMYNLLKGLRGTFTASYWNVFSKFYGYQLKDGYIEGEDAILDAVLQDFNVSHRIEVDKMKEALDKE